MKLREYTIVYLISGLRRQSSNFPPKVELVLEICRDPEHQGPVSHPKQESDAAQELDGTERRQSGGRRRKRRQRGSRRRRPL